MTVVPTERTVTVPVLADTSATVGTELVQAMPSDTPAGMATTPMGKGGFTKGAGHVSVSKA